MSSFTKFQKLVITMGAASGAALYYFVNYYDAKKQSLYTNRTLASWTTNYTPSCKWDYNWDHREPKSLLNPKKLHLELDKKEFSSGDKSNKSDESLIEQVKPKFARHLILVRHGEYNLEGTCDEERTLTNLGVKQAEATGQRLKQLKLPITNMVKSTMSRAQQTGTLISQSLPDVPVTNCNLLREGAPIPPEPPVGSWRPEPQFFKDGARIEAAFREYFHRADAEQKADSYTLLVCHGNVIRYFVCRALQFPPEAWLRISLNHASITWLTVGPSGRVVLRTLGDSGHLPPELITSK